VATLNLYAVNSNRDKILNFRGVHNFTNFVQPKTVYVALFLVGALGEMIIVPNIFAIFFFGIKTEILIFM
jgi:hypothetical protein